MKKILYASLLLFMLSNYAIAGWNGLTVHSRANCINNETISWDFTTKWWLFTTSNHYDNSTGQLLHSNGTGWQNTRRSASVHWGEAPKVGREIWLVHGWHWQNIKGRIVQIGEEKVVGCDIYDGWWDFDNK